MAIQTVFCVTGIETDLSLKRIVVQTNFKIKEKYLFKILFLG